MQRAMALLQMQSVLVAFTISHNAHYMVLFKNLTDVSQIMALVHQMYPRRTQFFLEAFAPRYGQTKMMK
jgi:hypothetical protein